MRILKMTATFGCLDQAVLEPRPGVNVLVLPNESGKSTWAAFLLAMFYGLDNRRGAKGRLAEKHRYQPWSGKPMSGIVELEHQGRILVIQRTSDRTRPFGAFRAWDKQTGLDVPELTADTCGRQLLGVEKAVFRRSAFLCGTELTVTPDEDLSRRLSRLAASGSSDDSYLQAEARLKLWQNRLRYHRTGLIPEKEAQLDRTAALLAEAQSLRRQRLENTLELERAQAEADELEKSHLLAEQTRRQQQRQTLEDATRQAEILTSRAARLPDTGALHRMAQALEQQIDEAEPAEPPCPPALTGLTWEEVWPKAQADAAQYEQLTAGRLLAMPVVFAIYAAVCLTAAAVLLCLQLWAAGAVCAGLALLCAVLWQVRRRRDRDVLTDRRAAKALLASYGVKKKEDLLTAAMVRRDWLQEKARRERQLWEQALLLERIQAFAPQVQTAAEAKQAVEEALALQAETEQATRRLELAAEARLHDSPLPPNPEIERLRRSCIRLKAENEGLLRQETLLGGQEALEARRRREEDELAELERRERAISLAREALAAANSQLTQRYAPRLTGLAGTYLHRLTEGKYDALLLEQTLTLSVRETASGLVRPLDALSRGAQDQAWLALRLAMTRLLLPEQAPIVLDDALLTFDPRREQAALAVLAEENRQVLLFACR